MFVKVKTIDAEGNEKGRAYTYESDIEVSEGDKVIADMAGSDKVLKVVGVATPTDYENVEFEIKKIKSIYTGEADSDGVLLEKPLDISIEDEILPVIRINFETLKAELTERLKNYAGIVVTEKTLQGCKATKKELAGLRTKIDTYRKDKKKALSAPITFFEEQCKDLIALIEKAEAPIKEGIKVFDDKKRNGKRDIAIKIITEVAESIGLLPKYAERIEVSEKYCNLTATDLDVRCDVQARAMTLRVEQDREAELLEIINDNIENANKTINRKIDISSVQWMINKAMPTKEIIQSINSLAKNIFEAEHPEPKVEPKIEPQTEETKVEEQPMYSVTYRITGKKQELLRVSQFLKENRLPYEVVGQREV